MPFKSERYPANWREISLRIRERSGGKCEWCGAPNGGYIRRYRDNLGMWESSTADFTGDNHWAKSVKVVLTVAHLDNDTTNNSDDNLRALCQRCHLRYDANYHAANAKATRAKKKQLEAQQAGQLNLFNLEAQTNGT